ncbi:glycerophosphodiester phosphodiesterase family protein [Microbacterium sp. G2-8]|uniref:glycerophosphodiester phosphodiesterase n=1 Tax=Microbacterium sp. G2-8 TaxID=2842454 RepID=UPI001C897193|nr:glycerophosphodiester phosphodiesterase family protein [Microbacterium sp. G2-8]
MRIRHLVGAGAVAAVGLSLVAVPASAAPGEPGQPEHVSTTVIAHRGASAYAPENTLSAFRVGIEQRATLIESDVQLSKDGVPVLLHDTTLTRTTNVEEVFPDRASHFVGDYTLDELKQLDAGSWFGEEFAGEQIPTLAEMVEQVRGSRSGIIMELKSPELHPGVEQAVYDVFASYPGYVNSALNSGRLSVQSFDWESMETYNEISPETPTGLLGTVPVESMAAYGEWADEVNPNKNAVTPEYVEAIHDAGMKTNVYTVNDEPTMHRLLDADVDGLISDVPDVVFDVLQARK